MIIVVNVNGTPVAQPMPANALKFPAGIPVRDLGGGRVLIGATADTPVASQAVTHWIPVTLATSWRATVTHLYTAEYTVSAWRLLTRHRHVTVLSYWESTHSLTREGDGSTRHYTGATVTRDHAEATRVLTATVTRHVDSICTTREVTCDHPATAEKVVTRWDPTAYVTDVVSRALICSTRWVTKAVTA